MREFPFELALCVHLESTEDAVVGRQLGAAVYGTPVVDVALVISERVSLEDISAKLEAMTHFGTIGIPVVDEF